MRTRKYRNGLFLSEYVNRGEDNPVYKSKYTNLQEYFCQLNIQKGDDIKMDVHDLQCETRYSILCRLLHPSSVEDPFEDTAIDDPEVGPIEITEKNPIYVGGQRYTHRVGLVVHPKTLRWCYVKLKTYDRTGFSLDPDQDVVYSERLDGSNWRKRLVKTPSGAWEEDKEVCHNLLARMPDLENVHQSTEVTFHGIKLKDVNGTNLDYKVDYQLILDDDQKCILKDSNGSTIPVYTDYKISQEVKLPDSFSAENIPSAVYEEGQWKLKYNGATYDIFQKSGENDTEYNPINDPQGEYFMVLDTRLDDNGVICHNWYLATNSIDTGGNLYMTMLYRYIFDGKKFVHINELCKYTNNEDSISIDYDVDENSKVWMYNNKALCQGPNSFNKLTYPGKYSIQRKIVQNDDQKYVFKIYCDAEQNTWEDYSYYELSRLDTDNLKKIIAIKSPVRYSGVCYQIDNKDIYIKDTTTNEYERITSINDKPIPTLEFDDTKWYWRLSSVGGVPVETSVPLYIQTSDSNYIKYDASKLSPFENNQELKYYWALEGDWLTKYNGSSGEWEKMEAKENFRTYPNVYSHYQSDENQITKVVFSPSSAEPKNWDDIDNDTTLYRIEHNPYKVLKRWTIREKDCSFDELKETPELGNISTLNYYEEYQVVVDNLPNNVQSSGSMNNHIYRCIMIEYDENVEPLRCTYSEYCDENLHPINYQSSFYRPYLEIGGEIFDKCKLYLSIYTRYDFDSLEGNYGYDPSVSWPSPVEIVCINDLLLNKN